MTLTLVVGIVSSLDAFQFSSFTNVVFCAISSLFHGFLWILGFFGEGLSYFEEWKDVSFFGGYSISLKDLALSGFFSAFVFFGAKLHRIVKRPNALLSIRMKCPTAKWVDVRRP